VSDETPDDAAPAVDEPPTQAQEAVDPTQPEPPRPRPSRVGLRRRRRLVSELADLPRNQAVAFLGRELDNRSHVSIAAQLGVSETASRILVVRAREHLGGLPPARAHDCVNVRVGLEEAHKRGARPSPFVREHLIGCDDCKAYRSAIARMDGRLSKLSPGAGTTALAGVARVVGGGPAAWVLAKGIAALLVVAAAVAAIVVVVKDQTSGSGSEHIHVVSLQTLSRSHKIPGVSIPNGAELVRATIAVPASSHGQTATIDMTCPTALRFRQLAAGNGGGDQIEVHSASGTVRGSKGTLQFTVTAPALPGPTTATATILCVRPLSAAQKKAVAAKKAAAAKAAAQKKAAAKQAAANKAAAKKAAAKRAAAKKAAAKKRAAAKKAAAKKRAAAAKKKAAAKKAAAQKRAAAAKKKAAAKKTHATSSGH
jgi:Sigma-70, region 4